MHAPPARAAWIAACRSLLAYADAMKILVLGAGNVGRAVVDALYEQHEITVIDLDGTRLAMLS
jgi:tRNA A37 threonylcarbamoyladenosine dehydratase